MIHLTRVQGSHYTPIHRNGSLVACSPKESRDRARKAGSPAQGMELEQDPKDGGEREKRLGKAGVWMQPGQEEGWRQEVPAVWGDAEGRRWWRPVWALEGNPDPSVAR